MKKLLLFSVVLWFAGISVAVDYPFYPNDGLFAQTGVNGIRKYNENGYDLEDTYVIRIVWTHPAGANAEIREDSSTDTVSSTVPDTGVYDRYWWQCPYGYIKLAQSGRPDDYITGIIPPTEVLVDAPFTPITAYYVFYYIFDGVGGTGVPPSDDLPDPVLDEYHYTINVSNTDPLYNVETASWLLFDDDTADVLVEQVTLYEGDVVQLSGIYYVERDSGEPIPESVQTQLDYGRFPGVGAIVNAFDMVPDGVTDSGGHIYEADVTRIYTVEVPEDPPDVDPTNPPVPTDPAEPSPELPGGDTSPVVALNYEAFRDAVESALDNRALSGGQIHDAVQSALDDQGMSATEIETAVQNALENQGMSAPEMQKAVAAGTADGNDMVEYLLSLIESNTRPDSGGAVTNDNSDVVDKLDEIKDLMGGSAGGISNTLEYAMGTNDGWNIGFDASVSNSIAGGGGFIGFVEDWFGSFFTLSLPVSIGQNPYVTFLIPGDAPGAIPFDDSIEIDISGWSAVPVIRAFEALILHISMIFLMARIYKAAW